MNGNFNPLNTHSYDKRLGGVKEELKEEIESISGVPEEEKEVAFQHLREYLGDRISTQEMGRLEKLISEKDKYYDPINDLRVDDLLYLCCIRITAGNEDFLNNFRQQLIDLRTGSCVQGRSIRLLQLLYAFE